MATPYTATRLRREVRLIRLRELGYRDYPHYLRSVHWADKRREYRESGLPQDCFCGEIEGIQLHHMTYERIGREEVGDLTPVCPSCHAMIHALANRGEIGLDFTGFVNAARAEQRQRNVEAAQHERLLAYLEDVAFMEDQRRTMQTIYKRARKRKLPEAHWIARVVSMMKKAERRMEVLQPQYT